MFNKVFGNNEKLDLQFNDNTLVGNLSNVDAYTETKSTGYQKSLTNITFNNVQLDSSSKEYIAATILHEVVHAWINYKYTAVVSNQYQHSLMAGSYRFNLMRIALQEMYPNLSTEDAIDLTWGGLTDTVEFSGLPVNERQRIISKNIDFKKGLKGTHC
ncbi:MAG: SprT-like domain-containing protein [Chitinophagaceae bacterium]